MQLEGIQHCVNIVIEEFISRLAQYHGSTDSLVQGKLKENYPKKALHLFQLKSFL